LTDPRATAIYVVYRTARLDLSWIPEFERVVVVHNDRLLDPATCEHGNVQHVFSSDNIGFGAGVNAALPLVETARVVLVNPDTVLAASHWDALAAPPPDDVVTVPLVDSDGTPTAVVSRYPTPASLALTAWRAGRLVPRGTATRNTLSRALGSWGRTHVELTRATGCWPLRDHWVSGAVLSVATERITAIGGFDETFFLYLEDADLCRRLSASFEDMRACIADVAPAVHGVGGSGDTGRSREVDRHYARSCRIWASREHGTRWRVSAAGVALRERSLAR